MQIVIDIPEEVYRAYKMDASLGPLNEDQRGYAKWYLINGLLSGTVLPKGHGDLIDRKELLKQPMDKANCPSNYVRIANAIIEADKTRG